MNRTMRAESGAEVAKKDVWDQVSALVGRFGHAGEQCAARFDFGISPEVIRGRMEPILGDARRIRLAGWGALPGGPVLRECLARLRDLAPKTYQKTVARIAGVFVIHSYFRSRMTQEAIGQAISTSSFYELTQDLLDGLLDGGGWTVREADRLYDRCLRPMTDSAVSTNGLEDELANFMGPGQDGLEHVLASATRALRGLLASSDERIRGLVREGHDALARAQAATVHFRHEGLDIPAVTNIAASLPSPDPSLPWLDRLAICASWPSSIALFDAGFTSAAVPQRELAAHARAWLSFNETVTFLEHFAGAAADLREGVFNIACLYANLPATPDLPHLAIDASPVKDALVNPVEHGAHRGRRHPVEVTEVGAPRGCLDLETTEVPLLRIYDGGPLGQGAQGHPAGELPSNRRERRGRRGEHRADERVAPVPESRLHQLEEFGARVDRDPGVFGDLPRVDRPRSDGSVKGLLALRIPESRENPEDAGASDLRDEPDVRGPARRYRNEPTVRAVEVCEQRGPRFGDAVDPAPSLRLGVEAIDEPAPSHLPMGSP